MAIVLGVAGCGSSNGPPTPTQLEDSRLRNVGELYRVYQVTYKAPPKRPQDLAALANVTPSGYEAIRSGEVVVRWGATLPDTKEEPVASSAPQVLAYLKTVPQQGGPVLLLDRTTREMTAEEFKSATLAKSN